MMYWNNIEHYLSILIQNLNNMRTLMDKLPIYNIVNDETIEYIQTLIVSNQYFGRFAIGRPLGLLDIGYRITKHNIP